MVDVSFLFGAVLLVDALAILALLWVENFTHYEGVVLWEEESPMLPLFWGSLIVLLAGILSLIEVPVWPRPAIFVNIGGVIAPLVVCGVILWRRRPAWLPLLVGSLFVASLALVAGMISGRPFFLPFPAAILPSAAAAAVGVAFCRRKLIPALDVAYVSASIGTLVGLDLVPLLGSSSGSTPSGSITLGSGGILTSPLSDYIAAHPNAAIVNASGVGGLRLAVGFASPTDLFDGNVDMVTVGVGGRNISYDFEPPSGCQKGDADGDFEDNNGHKHHGTFAFM